MNARFKDSVFRHLGWPVLCGILAAVIILEHFPSLPGNTAATSPVSSLPGSGTLSYAEAVQRAAPAVVNIYTSRIVREQQPRRLDEEFLRYFFGQGSGGNERRQERVQRSLGSGVIMSAQGYVLTNLHVINRADQILVMLNDGREALASVVGIDSETDLAVLHIELDDLVTLPVGNPAQAMVGDVVLAIGNPYGFGQTVTQGIISATGRYGLLQLSTYQNFIQTDAAINPGSSGGALVDGGGRLLGINTAIYSGTGGYQGIGLAIPSDLALKVMTDLIEHGKVIRGWLGIEVRPLSLAQAQANGVDINNTVVVTGLYKGGPAAQAGLRPGDLLQRINGQWVGDGHAGMNLIANLRPGTAIDIDIVREGEAMTLKAMVGSRPESDST